MISDECFCNNHVQNIFKDSEKNNFLTADKKINISRYLRQWKKDETSCFSDHEMCKEDTSVKQNLIIQKFFELMWFILLLFAHQILL